MNWPCCSHSEDNYEKREPLMQNSAAITENQKEKQRFRDLESEVDRLKSEVISNKLRLERANR